MLKLHPIIVHGSSKSLVVGFQPHRDALTEAARIPATVEINKDASEAEKNDEKEGRNDGRYLDGDQSSKTNQ